jgi:hypothetical protein
MDPTSLPTDNLYKFLALSGIIIDVAAVHLYFKRRADVNERLDELETQAAGLRVDIEEAKLQLEAAKEEHHTTAAKFYASTQRVAEVSRSHEVQKVKLGVLKRLRRELKLLTWVVAFALTIGTVAAAAGFYLWYDRLQKYQDRTVALGRP